MKIKNKEILYKGFYTYQKLIIEKKGETLEREQIDIGKVAAALVFDTSKQKYILVKQYRYGAEQELVEIVAGLVENKKDNPEKTIRKEISEETGYAVDRLESIKAFYPSPGASTEEVFLYYAEVSQKESEGGGLDEEHEDIEVLEYSWEELISLQLQDAKTMIAVQWLAARNKR